MLRERTWAHVQTLHADWICDIAYADNMPRKNVFGKLLGACLLWKKNDKNRLEISIHTDCFQFCAAAL